MAVNNVAIHQRAAWQEQANFVIFAKLDEGRWEQLWARKLSSNRFEVCCIPFFVYDLALGDEVVTSEAGGKRYVVQRRVKDSGHYPFRIWFGDPARPSPNSPQEVAARLRDLGVELEWSSHNLLAVDAVDQEHAQRVADFLTERQKAGHLIYETGRL